MSPRTKAKLAPESEFGHSSRPGGGGRGLLRIYILHLIAAKPRHGYEIIQDIQAKTEGAWSPGAGSIYPILKKLVSEGLIEAETPGAVDDRHVYRITPKGERQVTHIKEVMGRFGQKWSAMRSLIMELMGPENSETFVIDGSRRQFEFTREFVKSKMKDIQESEMKYVLKEYALDLERQLGWANQTLAGIGGRPAATLRKQ